MRATPWLLTWFLLSSFSHNEAGTTDISYKLRSEFMLLPHVLGWKSYGLPVQNTAVIQIMEAKKAQVDFVSCIPHLTTSSIVSLFSENNVTQ